MKRLICVLMIFCLFLSGCSNTGERIKEPVKFYYIQDDYQKKMEQVILAEVREASGHKDDLAYLLALYSMGPSTEDLRSPLPRNSVITLMEHTDADIKVRLSDGILTMTDADFTLASACIAMTCMELAEVAQVTVECGDRNITIRQDNLLLFYNGMIRNPQEEIQ